MAARGRKPTAAMPTLGTPAPGPSAPAALPQRPGWMCGSRVTAWKDFEPCEPGADWCEDVDGRVSRRKVIKIECGHKRGGGKKARALARGTDEYLQEVYMLALLAPCRYTECPTWVARNPR